MTKTEMRERVRTLREELENRYKYGTIKLADVNGVPISSEILQKELYSLIYKLSKSE
jgi:hypothetical protein